MSKAFVRDDGEGSGPAWEEPALPPGPRRVTPAGRARLAAELAVLEAAGVQAGVPGEPPAGDRERRLRWLRRLLPALTVVDAPPDDPERVFFGAWVTVEDDEGAIATYRLVGPDEVDASAGLISAESPVARALMGRREGDTATVRRPKGDVELRVVQIRYGDQADG